MSAGYRVAFEGSSQAPASAPPTDGRVEGAVHAAVDDLLGDDVTVIATPAISARVNCPVWQRIRECVKDPEWDLPAFGWDSAPEELASALRLPVDLVERYPVVGPAGVAVRALAHLGYPDGGEPRSLADAVMSAVDEWAQSHPFPRQHRMAPAGLERDFESWLVTELPVLEPFGFPVRLACQERDGVRGRQVRLATSSTADLVCRVERKSEFLEADAGDWLVIENKTVPVGQPAAWQLARYVDHLQAAVPEKVHGLLIADGTSVNLERALKERSFSYLSLAEIGYRKHLRSQAWPRVWDAEPMSLIGPDGTRADVQCEPV